MGASPNTRSACIFSVPMGDIAAALPATARVRSRWTAERIFYLGLAIAMAAAVVLGFSRTFFLRRWFPEWAQAHAAPESIFVVHGLLFTGWLALLVVQPSLVGAGRLELHKRLGWVGAALAGVMVVVGMAGSLVAARRPTGFFDVSMPPLQFLVVPFSLLVIFAVFVILAIVNRKRSQSHKRYMLLATMSLIEAGVARWPFTFMQSSPVPGFGMVELCVDAFLVPLVIWDLATRGRVHPVTLWGGLVLIANQPLRMMLSGTHAWHTFASWAVGLVN